MLLNAVMDSVHNVVKKCSLARVEWIELHQCVNVHDHFNQQFYATHFLADFKLPYKFPLLVYTG